MSLSQAATEFLTGRPAGVSAVSRSAGQLTSWVENGFNCTVRRDSAGLPYELVAERAGRGLRLTQSFAYSGGVLIGMTGDTIPTVFREEVMGGQSSVSGGAVGIGSGYWILGDSLTADNITSGGIAPGWNDYGPITWGQAKAGGRGRLLLNAGLSGDTCAQIYARLVTLLANTAVANLPACCFVLGGKNDTTAAAAKTNLALIYAALKASGIKTLACTIPPYQTGEPAATNSRAQIENDINDWVRAKCRTDRALYLVDMQRDLVNPLVDPMVSKATYMRSDNKHFAALGARATGDSAIYRAFIDNFPLNDRLICSTADSFGVNGSSNQLVDNPLMITPGGTSTPASGTITGTIPAGWGVVNASGPATGVVMSTPSRSDGYGNDMQGVITFAGATDNVRFNSPFFNARFTVGDTLQVTGVVSLTSCTNVSGIEFFLNVDPGGVTTFIKAIARTSTTFPQTDMVEYVFQSEEYTFTQACSYAQVVLRIWSTGAGGATMKLGRVSCRKIVAP